MYSKTICRNKKGTFIWFLKGLIIVHSGLTKSISLDFLVIFFNITKNIAHYFIIICLLPLLYVSKFSCDLFFYFVVEPVQIRNFKQGGRGHCIG